MRRRLDFHRELGEVLGGENAALLLVERRNLLGKLAPVEQIAGGHDPRRPVAAGVGLGVDEALERRGEVGLAENLADRRHPAAGQPHGCR